MVVGGFRLFHVLVTTATNDMVTSTGSFHFTNGFNAHETHSLLHCFLKTQWSNHQFICSC